MKTEAKTISSQRNYLFDNYRALLIFCVVLGHMLRRKLGVFSPIDTIYYFLYFFHMPAFIFISGYFAKNIEKSRDTAFKSFLIPYLIFNAIFWLEGRITDGQSLRGYHIFTTEWGLWFLLAVFAWKFFLKDLIKIRYILPLSFIVGVLSGYSNEFSTKMALSRIIAFFPFFILGYYCNESHINQLRKIPKIISVIFLAGFAVLAYFCVKYDAVKKESLYMWKPYSKVHEELFNGALIRCLIYIVAIVMSICFFNLLSTRKSWLSIIGQNSITVYILHLYLVTKLRVFTKSWHADVKFILFSVLVAIILTYFCSRPIVVKVYSLIVDKVNAVIFKEK